mgnify:FL=1
MVFREETRATVAMCERTTEDEPAPIGTRVRVPEEADDGEPIVTQTRAP